MDLTCLCKVSRRLWEMPQGPLGTILGTILASEELRKPLFGGIILRPHFGKHRGGGGTPPCYVGLSPICRIGPCAPPIDNITQWSEGPTLQFLWLSYAVTLNGARATHLHKHFMRFLSFSHSLGNPIRMNRKSYQNTQQKYYENA